MGKASQVGCFNSFVGFFFRTLNKPDQNGESKTTDGEILNKSRTNDDQVESKPPAVYSLTTRWVQSTTFC